MEGNTIGFVIWCAVGVLFIGLAVYSWVSQKPIGFWANAEIFEVSDTKRYNHAMSKLFLIFGVVFIALGIPLLAGKNSAGIIFSIIGVMVESVMAMVIYSTIIEKKYRK